jgi:hypothetical protein
VTKTELLLVAEFLDHAASMLVDNTCNDYEIVNTPANRLIEYQSRRWAAPLGPEDEWEIYTSPDNTKILTIDFGLMRYLAYRARQDAD